MNSNTVTRIVVIGRDSALFDERSVVRARVREYAARFEEYHIVCMTRRGFMPMADGPLFLWPTNSLHLFIAPFDAVSVAVRLIHERGVGLIDAQDPAEAGLAAWRAAERTGLPFRVQIHTDIMSQWYRRTSWKERIRWLVARMIIPRASCIRAVSERIKRSLVTAGLAREERIAILPIWTDVDRFQKAALATPRAPSDVFRMITVGRLVDKEKNFSLLIRAMAELVKSVPQARLTIVGEGPDRGKYEALIKTIKLEKHVFLFGKGGDDLPEMLARHDLFVLPSWFEGWGRAVVEAMAAGLPIVMTDVGLAGELVRDGIEGRVVPVGDKKALFEALFELLQNFSLRERLGIAARAAAAGLKPETPEEYYKLYQEHIGRCRVP